MPSTLLRRSLTAAMAIAALAAVVALAPVSSAEAGPEKSPFAGTYDWSSWPAPITISDSGRITSSYTSASDNQTKGSISGRIDDEGSYSFTVKQTFPDIDEGFGRGHGQKYLTFSNTSTGSMAPDADGNIIVTAGNGGSFVWLRQ